MSIILTGATGKLGSSVLEHLLKLVPANEIIASVYNTDHQQLQDLGIQIRHGDYTQPETLLEAFKGAKKLLLVSLPSYDDEYRIRSQRAAIDAAKTAGVKHIYYTSLNYGNDPKVGVMNAHLATEEYLKASGLTYTIIREGTYMDSFSVSLGFFSIHDKAVNVPSDGRIAFADREELGEATAKIVAGDDYKNQTVVLSGARAYSLKETTELISKIIGRDIEFNVIPAEEWIKLHADKGGVTPWWSTSYPAIKRGDTAVLSPALENLLERPSADFETKLRVLLKGTGKSDSEMNRWLKREN
ncbi:hypothetical protein K7432_007362 [Basidiobolus ranarum]|uniref:NmrA-like domain-containing protein n=1 Tax=Basidiobolus ranarum TaxID=34480 RepID=A0ABR2W072_9FUNG